MHSTGTARRLCIAILAVCAFCVFADERSVLRLATTTSTENSGLLAELLPAFTKSTGITVHVIAVGTGKALKLGENGDVDVVLVHDPELEAAFVEKGFGVDRRSVMYNDFIFVGPPQDPASIRGMKNAAAALAKIAAVKAPFVSRGDESGTHQKEKKLWAASGISPEGPWYMAAGQGMGEVLMIAHEKQGYTLADRGTYIAFESKISLPILVEGDSALNNPYHVMAVNPARYAHVKYTEALRFIDWLTSDEGRKLIAGFRKNGKQLFFPSTDAVTTVKSLKTH